MFRPTTSDVAGHQRDEMIITEGAIDALSAAAAGYRSVAFLAAGYPDRAAAVVLARMRGLLVVAFDPDPAGRAGADRLVKLLAAQHREAAVLQLPHGDLNACAVASADWPVELAARVEHATFPLRNLPPALVQGMG
jgi:DNA primase